jgi:hypothetical protein
MSTLVWQMGTDRGGGAWRAPEDGGDDGWKGDAGDIPGCFDGPMGGTVSGGVLRLGCHGPLSLGLWGTAGARSAAEGEPAEPADGDRHSEAIGLDG